EHLDEVAALRDRVAELQLDLARHKQRLASSEARFRLLADAAPIMIWMSGDDGLSTFFNRAWLEFRGRRLEDELGNRWVEASIPRIATCVWRLTSSASARASRFGCSTGCSAKTDSTAGSRTLVCPAMTAPVSSQVSWARPSTSTTARTESSRRMKSPSA